MPRRGTSTKFGAFTERIKARRDDLKKRNFKYELLPVSTKHIEQPVRLTSLGGTADKTRMGQVRKSVTAPELGIGEGNNVMRFNSSNGLWIGNKVFSSAPFSVSIAGALTATSGTISGDIVIASGGAIRSGQTDYNTGNGFWLGNDSGTPKFSLGSSTSKFLWDGIKLTLSTSSNTNPVIDVISTGSATCFNINNGGLIGIGFAPTAVNANCITVLDVLTTTVNTIEYSCDAKTTGGIAKWSSNSSSSATRTLFDLINDNTGATGTLPFRIQQDALISTNFQKLTDFGGSVIWRSDGTTPNGNLNGTAGDICLNGASSEILYCKGGTVWTGPGTGALFHQVTTVNAATYDVLATDNILNVTYTGTGAVTSLTLPTAQVVSGRVITIKDAGGNAGTNNITIDTEGTETIDGAATQVISGDYDAVRLYSDGVGWFIY